ncbi:carcinoembryonic antigen-related cell adhesion molecule 3-like isoform X1 [Dromiciops gliroides]|uniref:carcinoembryonic antigen-related cell adhesion molecule 3-like isoform X1 n=1 Tax=Dromiciops gliroides TaxID=33562 RepID=UPI001CC63A73|nr:carcinoembryonic antigen-related cell adhesion molecule 3-like isoform X1 [Dromiciops gliroides]
MQRFLARTEVVTHSEQHRLMKMPSEAPHSGGSPWKGLLITASILSCWIQVTSAQGDPVTVVPSPSYGTVGSSVTLTIQGLSEQALSYSWYRKSLNSSNLIAAYSVSSGVQTPADIREKVFSNGSLLIPDLTLDDNDVYIVEIVDLGGKIAAVAQGQLAVYAETLQQKGKDYLFYRSIITIVSGAISGVILLVALIYFLFFRKNRRFMRR